MGKGPKVDDTPLEETAEDKRRAKKSRVALLETENGILGEELAPQQTGTRDTILGN